jgi:hypothetical protein
MSQNSEKKFGYTSRFIIFVITKTELMKKNFLKIAAMMFTVIFLTVSCSTPVGLSSWKNPQANIQVSRVVVMALLDKLSYMQPVEDELVAYFNSQNTKSIRSLDFLTPFKQYPSDELQKKFDSVGADAVLLITYKGTDVSVDVNQGYYGGYRGRWGSPGYVSTTSTVNIRAKLYATKGDMLLWTGDLTLTDPDNPTSSAKQVAPVIFADWLKNNLLKNPPPPPQK